MKISEVSFTINKNGWLKIPATLLRRMGLKPGDHVQMAYLTQDGQHNLFREFLLSPSSMLSSTESQYISIAHELLEQASIADDAAVQIICFDGCIVIAQDAGLSAKELSTVLEWLQTANGLAEALPCDRLLIPKELKNMIDSIGEEPV